MDKIGGITMEIKRTSINLDVDKGPRQKKSLRRGFLTVAAILSLGLLLASCSVPRYGGGYGGYGHHRYMIEDSPEGE